MFSLTGVFLLFLVSCGSQNNNATTLTSAGRGKIVQVHASFN
jgi:hypothetical protein